MSSKHLRQAIIFFVYVTVIGTPLFYFSKGTYPFIVSKSLFFQAAAECTIFLWIALMVIDKQYRPKRTPLTLTLAILFGALTLTAVFGSDPWRSFWSTHERAVGVITLWHLFGLFLVVSALRRDLYKPHLWYTSIATASIVSFIAEWQLRVPDLLVAGNTSGRPGATFGNPTFLSGYLLFHLFLGVYFSLDWLRNRHTKTRSNIFGIIFLAGSFLIQFLALLHTETRGDLIALGAGTFVLIFLFVIKPPIGNQNSVFARRSFYGAILGLVLLGSIGFWFTRSSALWDNLPGIRRFRALSFSGEELMPRVAALKAAWEGVKEKPFLGWGWDNFNIVFNKHYDPKLLRMNYQETRFDKPHNFLAEYAIAGGVLLLLAALAVFCVFVYQALMLKDGLFGKIAIAAMVAYVVRNMFFFETIGPLLMGYLLMAAVDGKYVTEYKPAAEQAGPRRARIMPAEATIAYLTIGAGIAAIYFVNFLSLQALYYQYHGFNYFLNRRNDLAIQNFKRAVTTWSPYGWNLKRDYATAVVGAYFNNPDKIPQEEARLAVQAMEGVVREHPRDAYNHYSLANMYNQVSDIDPQYYLPRAEREAQIALELSPDRQEVYFYLAKTETLRGDNEKALELLRHAIDLDPEIPEGHFYYGLVAFASGKPAQGFEEVEKAIVLGLKLKDPAELRVAANYYVDSGHVSEAIPLYKKLLEIDESDFEIKMKLGLAYYFSNQFDEARRYILEVAGVFDFKSSPAYPQLKPIFKDLGLDF